MAHGKRCGEEDCRQILPVGGEKDECQAWWDGQQEDDEAEVRDGQDLEHGADGVRHGCGRIRAQGVVRCGNGKPDEVGEHHQQEEEQAPWVEAETVLF